MIDYHFKFHQFEVYRFIDFIFQSIFSAIIN